MTPLFAALILQGPVPKFQDPPGPESEPIRRQIDLAAEEIRTLGVSAILANANYDPVRPYPRFREIVKNAANAKPLTMVSPIEPGEKLELTFDLGKSDQLIYLYHTDARGAHGANGVHISGNSGDHRFARLFAYAKTGPDGKVTVRTIRPAGYPGGELPQHVHFHVSPSSARFGEIWFADDPRLTSAIRARGRNEALIVEPRRTRNGWQAVAKVPLRDAPQLRPFRTNR